MDHQIILQDLQTILIITIITTQSQVAIVIQDQVIITQDQVITILGLVIMLYQDHLHPQVEVVK